MRQYSSSVQAPQLPHCKGNKVEPILQKQSSGQPRYQWQKSRVLLIIKNHLKHEICPMKFNSHGYTAQQSVPPYNITIP